MTTNNAVNNYGVPAGTILDFGGTTAPAGFLLCDGSVISRSTYAALFTAIGVVWGAGDGFTTFGVPNFSRKVAVGSGGSSSITLGNAVGNTGGEETHVQTLGELAAHAHTLTSGNIGMVTSFDTNTGTTIITRGSSSVHASTTASNLSGTVDSAGSSTPFNVMQPSNVVLKIIKY